MFRNTAVAGFHMTFANGLTISIQFSRSRNYVSGSTLSIREDELPYENATAEIAIWGDQKSDWYSIPDHGDVCGYQTADEVAAWIAAVSKATSLEDIVPPIM